MGAVFTEPVYHTEFIDGQETQKALPKKLHILIQRFLILVLTRDLPAPYLAMPELNVLTGKTVEGRREYVIPDLTVTMRDAVYADGDLAEAPALAVEILSPGQTVGDLVTRSQRLLNLGTPMCWIIWPERRKCWMHTADDLAEAADAVRFVLPDGVSVQVSLPEMWAELND